MSSERIMNLLVTIPAESRRMNVGKDVIRILGSPAYICILQRKDRQSIAITPCAAEHPMSFKVPDRLLTDGQCRMRINAGIPRRYQRVWWQEGREVAGLCVYSDVVVNAHQDARYNPMSDGVHERKEWIYWMIPCF